MISHPALFQFFAGYFHQDFGLEGETDIQIVTAFKRNEPRSVVEEVRDNLRDVIERCENEGLSADDFLEENECYYYYAAEQKTGLQWMKKLYDLLKM
ncbi:contact-dependent growth inhibition system immunity protein [Rhizobium sp. CNPSo 3464]|uniref:contact-dependent growth inhibition system immunity protein n=1 Tax=Rhizobium sp. CNPSo 3464 TaxID=3021406 RepID=UPI00255164EA|nr:contact-dependent growth inhibition system immunity protein [Rhizobium sp. CNPSo 3464]MDK4743555.1 contact-dependent growth inhibition system immunity protein [Rhizobium sp. CNPSo 3464]